MSQSFLEDSSTSMAVSRDQVASLLRPRSVAVIGASNEKTKIGGLIVRLLSRHGFPGQVYPVNPKYDEVAGLPCYPDIGSVPADEPVDTAILFVSASRIVEIAQQCGERGVKSLVVITSGFAEMGAQGQALQSELVGTALAYDMAMSGPNCAGIANFAADYVAYGTSNFIELEHIVRGRVALLTASGGFGNTVFTYCQERELGLSHLIGLGNEAATSSAEFLDVLVDDPDVDAIVANLESIRNPGLFFRAADRAADAGKPVIVMKGGRSEAGQHAIVTHTAALGGSPEAFAGAFRQHGVLQVTDLDQLADTALIMSRAPHVTGNRIGIFSLAGGGTGLLSDIAADFGFTIPELDAGTVDTLTEVLPALAAVQNPLDPTAGFARDGERLLAALVAFADDPNIDAVVFFPLAAQVSYAEHIVRILITAKQKIDKPLIVIWTAGRTLVDGPWRKLHEAGVALFTNSTDAFCALDKARQYNEFQENRIRPEASDYGPYHRTRSEVSADTDPSGWIRELGRFGIAFPQTRLVHSAQDAATAVAAMGKCALKISSADITHKTEAGGVRLGVGTAEEAQIVYHEIEASCRAAVPHAEIEGIEVQQMVEPGVEVLLGVRTDDQLGPILTVGLGGVFTELVRDVAQRPVPISRLDAEHMLDELRGAQIFEGYRGGPPADRANLVEKMLGLSALADAIRDTSPEIEINPLVIHELGRGSVAVDLVAHLGARQ